jgi:alkanesulfonate monooxygenase SsuD/methylene tetrahydromethanopterin reductase-like flavin-dependent oxidoreductase (luciferase family)
MFSAFAVDPEKPIARFIEGLQIMKALWTEPSVNFEGRFWQLTNAAMEPKPFQKPCPPIWFGGSHPAAVRRAVRYGDGFFGAGSQTTAQFAGQVQILREALAESGRSESEFRIAKRVYIAVDDDANRARQRISDALEKLYGYFGLHRMESVAVFGPPDECVRGLAEVAAAGAQMILLDLSFRRARPNRAPRRRRHPTCVLTPAFKQSSFLHLSLIVDYGPRCEVRQITGREGGLAPAALKGRANWAQPKRSAPQRGHGAVVLASSLTKFL